MMATGRRGFAAGLAAGVVLGIGVSVGVALAVSSGSVVTAATAVPQPAALTQSSSKVVLENARVRVKDAWFAPGVKNPMHTHELAHVGVVIQGGTLVFKYPDGKSETMELAQGGAGFRDANVSHEAFNPGKTPVRVIEVELK